MRMTNNRGSSSHHADSMSSKDKTLLVSNRLIWIKITGEFNEVELQQRQWCGLWLRQLRWDVDRSQEQIAADTQIDLQEIVLIEYGISTVQLTAAQLDALSKQLSFDSELRRLIIEAIRYCTNQGTCSNQLLERVTAEVEELFTPTDNELSTEAISAIFAEAFNELFMLPEEAYTREHLGKVFPQEFRVTHIPLAVRILSLLAARRRALDIGQIAQTLDMEGKPVGGFTLNGVFQELKKAQFITPAMHRGNAFEITTQGLTQLSKYRNELNELLESHARLRRGPLRLKPS